MIADTEDMNETGGNDMGTTTIQHFRYLQVRPKTMQESIDLSDMLVEEIQSIKTMLDDRSRMERMTPVEYMSWERRAKRAKWIKEQQQGELRAWRASQVENLTPEDASLRRESKRQLRQLAHTERIEAAITRAQVCNPLDTVELLRLLRSVLINCIDDGIEFSESEEALLEVTREHLHLMDGEASALKTKQEA